MKNTQNSTYHDRAILRTLEDFKKLRVCLRCNEMFNLFKFLVYYLWVSFYFLVLFISLIVLSLQNVGVQADAAQNCLKPRFLKTGLKDNRSSCVF